MFGAIIEKLGHPKYFSASCTPQVITILDPNITANLAREEVSKLGFKYIDWAPHGFAVVNEVNYFYYNFPLDIVPLEKEESVESYFERTNLLLPSDFGKGFLYKSDHNAESRFIYRANTDSSIFPKLLIEGKNAKDWLAKNAPILYVIIACQDKKEYSDSIDHTKIPLPLFRDILLSVLRDVHPSYFFKNLERLGLLEHLVPELHETIGCTQDPEHHTDDVYTHSLKSLDACFASGIDDPIIKLAVLFHDIGKARTRKEVYKSL